MISPYTSSWNWRVAALPILTGRRPLVAGEPVEGELGKAPLARWPVHDLQLIGCPGSDAQQPVAPGDGLGLVAAEHEGVEAEGGIAQPAVPVVPVPDTADVLRQRGGRGRDEAAGRRVGERLQRDQ